MPSFFACDVPSFLLIYPKLTIARLYVLAVHWSCPTDANASAWWCWALPRGAECFCLWCVSFFTHMSWATSCHIICPSSPLKLHRRCWCQGLVMLSSLPVMCQVFCIYVLSSQLPHYVLAVNWSFLADAKASARWCWVLPRDAEFFCLWCAEFFGYMSWAHSCHIICPGSELKLPGGCQGQCQVVPGIAKRSRNAIPNAG